MVSKGKGVAKGLPGKKKSEFRKNFLSKTPVVHLVVGVSTETYNFIFIV